MKQQGIKTIGTCSIEEGKNVYGLRSATAMNYDMLPLRHRSVFLDGSADLLVVVAGYLKDFGQYDLDEQSLHA